MKRTSPTSGERPHKIAKKAEATIGDLPVEILAVILVGWAWLYLPAARLVCRRWNAAIDDHRATTSRRAVGVPGMHCLHVPSPMACSDSQQYCEIQYVVYRSAFDDNIPMLDFILDVGRVARQTYYGDHLRREIGCIDDDRDMGKALFDGAMDGGNADMLRHCCDKGLIRCGDGCHDHGSSYLDSAAAAGHLDLIETIDGWWKTKLSTESRRSPFVNTHINLAREMWAADSLYGEGAIGDAVCKGAGRGGHLPMLEYCWEEYAKTDHNAIGDSWHYQALITYHAALSGNTHVLQWLYDHGVQEYPQTTNDGDGDDMFLWINLGRRLPHLATEDLGAVHDALLWMLDHWGRSVSRGPCDYFAAACGCDHSDLVAFCAVHHDRLPVRIEPAFDYCWQKRHEKGDIIRKAVTEPTPGRYKIFV